MARQALAVARKKRCRMHGGANGSGVPIGNQNALKHGNHKAKAEAFRKHVRDLPNTGHKKLEPFFFLLKLAWGRGAVEKPGTTRLVRHLRVDANAGAVVRGADEFDVGGLKGSNDFF